MKYVHIFALLVLIVFSVGCCATIKAHDEGVTITVSGSEVVETALPNVTPMNITQVNTSGWYMSGTFDPVRPNEDSWVCYDYSIDYSRKNPEWGIVTMSGNRCFKGISHMVNYKMVNDSMFIHDEMYGYDCHFRFDNRTIDNPYYKYTFYHFYDINETPLRNYRYMLDNSETYFVGS
jgi:hypothetical protein